MGAEGAAISPPLSPYISNTNDPLYSNDPKRSKCFCMGKLSDFKQLRGKAQQANLLFLFPARQSKTTLWGTLCPSHSPLGL